VHNSHSHISQLIKVFVSSRLNLTLSMIFVMFDNNSPKDIDDCAGVTCQNGAVCKDYINRFECECKLGFDGTYCEHCKYLDYILVIHVIQ